MERQRLVWLFWTIFVVVWFGFCCCEGAIEIVTSAICQGGNKCNDGSYFCDSNDCTLLCSSASTCQNSILTCNSTFVNSTCEVKCNGVHSCKNLQLISYASETIVTCQESSNSADEVCQNATFTIQSTNDSDSNSFTIDCLTTNACNTANIYCSSNVDSCSATCQSADACDDMRMICDATQECSLQYDFATSCTDCHYYCPYMESNSNVYNYTQDCSCVDQNSSHVCSNVLEPSSSPTSLPSMEPSSMPTNEPAEIVPTAQPSAPILAPTVVPTTVNNNGNETNGMISTTAMASTTENGNTSTINGNENGNAGDELSASDDGDVSDIDVLWYNIVFAITFLVIVFYAAKEVFTLYQIGFFKNHSEISVIPTIFLIALWQFLCCMVLGFTETYVSNENVKSGTFVSSVTIPINLYTVLALMVAVLCYNKYPEMQRSLFAPLTRSIECLSSHCQVGSYYNFMLFIFLVVFILWMIITASLSGDNQSDLEFNSTMIVLYCLIGAYFAMLVLSAALSYSQRHDISLGNARSCCNPCIITILHRERKQKQDKEYYEKEGLSKEALEENEHKFWTFEPGCMIKACDCDVVTKEVLFGAAIGACLFFMFLFYMALAYDIGSTSADSVRCVALLFEVLSLIFLLIGHRYLGPESATRIDDNIVIEDETLPYQGHVRHQPSMDVVVHARKKNDPHGRNNLSNNDHPNMPYETLKDRTHHHQHHDHQNQASIDDGPHKSKNLFCCCFHKNQREKGPNNHELRIDTDTEDTYMSASNNPPPASPSPLIQAYQSGMKKLAKFSLASNEKNNSSNKLSVSTPRNDDDSMNSPKESQLDDADALKFDIKNVKKLIEDKVEYVEILAKRCVKQSQDIWKIARITYMDDLDNEKTSMSQSFRITVSYLDNTGIETLDLGNDVDAARFRVLLFGHPEPHKLPMHDWFGVPQILIDLLEKLFAPQIKGQHTEGIFRVPAEGSKLKHYRTAVCQYKINTYDYRLATQFKEQKDKDNAFDVHCIAGLIKEWLRKFPETIVVYDEETQKLIPHKTKSPNDHLKQNMFDWLSYLIPVLADEKNENQMNVTALAIVIAPNLIGEDLEPIQHLKLANELNKNFAAHCEKMASELEENPVIEWINEKHKEANEYIDDLSDDDDNHESDEKDVELPRYKTPQ